MSETGEGSGARPARMRAARAALDTSPREAWAPGEVSPAEAVAAAPVYAALDLGSNNCRLLIAAPAEGGFRVLDAFSRIVCLGEGVSTSGLLSPAAVTRTMQALKVCAAKMRRAGVTRSRAVATEACRRARNGESFLAHVRRETGIKLEIITSAEEADLGLRGCLPLLSPERPHALLFDIGGGSTEVSWVEIADGAPRLRASESLSFGVVGLTERRRAAGGEDDGTVAPARHAAMVAEVAEALARFEARHGLARFVADDQVQMLGTSGTVTTLVGVHKDLPRYDRARVDGSHLDFDTVAAVCRRIAAMSHDERVAHPCIGPERAGLVIAGCAILEAICRTWPVGRLRVADRGLREGILLTEMAADRALGAIGPFAPLSFAGAHPRGRRSQGRLRTGG